MQFVTDLNDKYARILSASQNNATFEVGELVSRPEGSAVHMFQVSFEFNHEVRFELQNTTAYCGGHTQAVAAAQKLAFENGPVVELSSKQRQGDVAQPAPSGGNTVAIASWLIALLVVAGARHCRHAHALSGAAPLEEQRHACVLQASPARVAWQA